jgi:hypothetical protein
MIHGYYSSCLLLFFYLFSFVNFLSFFGQRKGIAMGFMEGVGAALHRSIVWHRK